MATAKLIGRGQFGRCVCGVFWCFLVNVRPRMCKFHMLYIYLTCRLQDFAGQPHTGRASILRGLCADYRLELESVDK